jgi:hypothetical protein
MDYTAPVLVFILAGGALYWHVRAKHYFVGPKRHDAGGEGLQEKLLA